MDPAKSIMEDNRHSLQAHSAKAADTVRPAGSVAWVASGIGPRICFAPEGATGGLAGVVTPPSPSPAPVSPAPVITPPAAVGATPPVPANPAPAKVERPEWLPETLWDGDKGFKKQDFDDLVAFKTERVSAEASRPETADAYEVALPKDFKLPENIKLAEGQSIINPDDPRIAELRKVAHEKGWSQQDFQDVLAMGVNLDIAADQGRVESLKAESAKLGSRAQQRIDAVTSWVDAKLGDKHGNALKQMMFTAEQVEAFERLIALNRGSVPGTPGAGRDTGKTELSDDEWNKMSPSARINYARQASAK